jgi:hypothetical protein
MMKLVIFVVSRTVVSQTGKVEAKVVLAIHPVISSNSPSLPTVLRADQSSLAAHPSACIGKHESLRDWTSTSAIVISARLTCVRSVELPRDFPRHRSAPSFDQVHALPRGIARSILADANEARNWRVCADCAQVLTAIARPLRAPCAPAIQLAQI